MDDIRAALIRDKVDAKLIDLGTAMKTAEAAAVQLGVHVSRIFKSLVVKGKGDQVAVVVLPGDARADLRAVAKLLGWKKVRFADAETVLRMTGYPPGGTPPVGHRHPLKVMVDSTLMEMEEGYGGGGRPELLLLISPAEIVRQTDAVVASVSTVGEQHES